MIEELIDSDSSHFCAVEGEPIPYYESVVALTVVVVAVNGGVSYALNADGSDLLYPVQLLLRESWKDTVGNIQDALEERRDPNVAAQPIERAPEHCFFCNAGILPGEVAIRAVLGEIGQSNRAPNGVRRTETFEPDVNEVSLTLMCLACEHVTFSEVVAFWRTPIRQHKECPNGTATKCWRHGCGAVDSPTTCRYAARQHERR